MGSVLCKQQVPRISVNDDVIIHARARIRKELDLIGKTLKSTSTISDVKNLIQEHEGIPPDQQDVIHKNKSLDDNDHINQYVIYENGQWHLYLYVSILPELKK